MRSLFARRCCRYVGEPVAMVLADEPELAPEDPPLTVELDIPPAGRGRFANASVAAAPCCSARRAMRHHFHAATGDVEAAFATPVHAAGVFPGARQTAFSMETRAHRPNGMANASPCGRCEKLPFFNRRVPRGDNGLPETAVDYVEYDVRCRAADSGRVERNYSDGFRACRAPMFGCRAGSKCGVESAPRICQRTSRGESKFADARTTAPARHPSIDRLVDRGFRQPHYRREDAAVENGSFAAPDMVRRSPSHSAMSRGFHGKGGLRCTRKTPAACTGVAKRGFTSPVAAVKVVRNCSPGGKQQGAAATRGVAKATTGRERYRVRRERRILSKLGSSASTMATGSPNNADLRAE